MPAAEDAELLLDAPAEVKDRFTITDAKSADWYLKVQAGIAAEMALIQAQTAQRVKELKADAARLTFLFERPLRTFAEAEAKRRRRKTITLPHGTLSLRKKSAGWAVVDETKALPQAQALGCVNVKPAVVTVDKKAYIEAGLKWAEEHEGEMPPGIEMQEERESFSVKYPGMPKPGEEEEAPEE